jgi:hypothetical protein
MMPSFAFRPPIFNKRLRPRELLPITGSVKLSDLIEHCSLAYEYSTSLTPKDVPRLWWTSDEARRLEIYAALLQIGAVATDKELVRASRYVCIGACGAYYS